MLMRLVVLAIAAAAIWSLVSRRRVRRPEEVEGALAPPPAGAAPAGQPSATGASGGPAASSSGTDRFARQPEAANTAATSGDSAAGGRAPAAPQPPAEPRQERRIKGNDRGGEKLYHLPMDETYDQVIEERLFATREEAEAAGYHHAQQPS